MPFREFSKETSPEDVPYYPKRLAGDVPLLREYATLTTQEFGASFLGRLATCRYLNMDQVIGEALDFAKLFLRSLQGTNVSAHVLSRPCLTNMAHRFCFPEFFSFTTLEE